MFAAYFYRIYETGKEIDLDLLEKEMSDDHNISRQRFLRVKPSSIQLDVPPLLINLGNLAISHRKNKIVLQAKARIYDIGAVSICLSYENKGNIPADLTDFALSFAGQKGLEDAFSLYIDILANTLSAYLGEIKIDPDFYEDYTIYRITSPEEVTDPMPVLMGEKTDFSPQMRQQIMNNTLSYSRDDFAIISWDTALLCDPEDPEDLRDLIEFANVQLLELRYYDAILNRHMEKMYADIEEAEKLSRYARLRLYRQIMTELMEIIADITEVTEKIKNFIKITEDIYYARVYETTLRVLRTYQWSESLTRTTNVIYQNYSLLSNEVNVQHSNFLEWIIIILIALEFLFAILQTVF
ncbi:hypothetical protein SAMN02745221_02050 [Thermosyntropha lipolytica DSM 11003]|uniref:DUF155 domain-containing protein n=1 Tax=Thermosyntropha lipolytica DSM 11003 TaxID=1123382 RepID=A0A1M5RJC0_9FIRM|nr:hypothetical protein [Thermosyntropha lipolytica]SHH26375.1 hypothetical protein SAMN02745221_02050 [Thermosyntropha lipolytica DSM 11003]